MKDIAFCIDRPEYCEIIAHNMTSSEYYRRVAQTILVDCVQLGCLAIVAFLILLMMDFLSMDCHEKEHEKSKGKTETAQEPSKETQESVEVQDDETYLRTDDETNIFATA